MAEPLSIIHLITGASVVVQLVMLLLLGASIISWWYIFSKIQQFRQIRQRNTKFRAEFWGAANLKAMYEQLEQHGEALGLEAVFVSGYREFTRQNQQGCSAKQVVAACERMMRVASAKQLDALELRLGFLATVGSTSPYVGLFGTVIGIMNAFRGLGNARQATLSMVAPGIAEALVATAIGLLAAIPAVVAYNKFSNEIEHMHNDFDNFKDEFAGLINRQLQVKVSAQ